LSRVPLPEVYDAIKPSLVFFSPKTRERGEETPRNRMPAIIGTGFVVDDGLVVTNDHVIERFDRFPKVGGGRGHPAVCANILLPVEGQMMRVSIEVASTMVLAPEERGADLYGSIVPDIGIVTIAARGLPRVEVTEDLWPLPEGTHVATAGFPMGEDMMVAGEHMTQMAPTLQDGIVSALIPYRTETARGFVANITSYGGSSGSPVFLTNRPLVVGLLYAGLDYPIIVADGRVTMIPTPFTYCVPGTDVAEVVGVARTRPECRIPRDAPTVAQLIEQNKDILERRMREGPQEPRRT
jgi:Trypsin-like peptidase domain